MDKNGNVQIGRSHILYEKQQYNLTKPFKKTDLGKFQGQLI
ncbi:hypothetical protein AB1K18_13275 [Peribacillus simplex]